MSPSVSLPAHVLQPWQAWAPAPVPNCPGSEKEATDVAFGVLVDTHCPKP